VAARALRARFGVRSLSEQSWYVRLCRGRDTHSAFQGDRIGKMEAGHVFKVLDERRRFLPLIVEASQDLMARTVTKMLAEWYCPVGTVDYIIEPTSAFTARRAVRG